MTQIFVLRTGRADWPKDLHQRASKEGAAEGAAGRPAADATTIDTPEAKIRGEVHERVLATNGLLHNELNRINPTLAKHLGELAENQHRFDARHVAEVSRHACESALTSRTAQLIEAHQKRHGTQGHYNHFRFQHKITHDPDHPEDKLHYLSLIFLILAFETVLNAGFWTGSMGGFVATALLISFILSAINISLGFFTGVLFSHKNRSEANHRALGWSSLVVGSLLICAVNYYIITHRSTVDTFGGGDSGASINKLLTMAMFVVGVLFAVLSMLKGYRFFGSVPGYESASRQYIQATREMKALIELAKDEVNAERRSQEDLRKRLITRSGELKVKAAEMSAHIQNVRMQYRLALGQLQQVLRSCVKAYRDANRAVRTSQGSSPAYFADPVEEIESNDEGLLATEQSVAAYASEVERHFKAMQEASATETAQVKEIAALYVGPRLNEWNEEADREGLRRYEASVRSTANAA